MKYFFDIGNRYAKNSSWKDYALVKICLFSLGILAGLFIPFKEKKEIGVIAGITFLLTYIPLIMKLFSIIKDKQQKIFKL